MKLKKLVAILTIFFTSYGAQSEVTYTETADDFSNEKVYSLRIPSNNGGSAVVFISCYPKNKLNVQLAITGTMFPDSTTDEGMVISTTHKFDKAEAAITSDWYMNMMKYKNSWYQGDKVEFAKHAATSNQLNLRLDKRNDIFKFPLKGTSAHMTKILSECGAKI